MKRAAVTHSVIGYVSFVLAGVLALACSNGADKSAAIAEPVKLHIPEWPLSTKSAAAKAHILEGDQASFAGDYDRAYDEYKRAVAEDTNFAYGYLRLWERNRDEVERKTYLERAIKHIGSANATERIMIQVAQKEYLDNDRAGAIVLLDTLTQLHPNNARAWGLLAGRHLILGNIKVGRELSEKAIRLDSAFAGPMLTLGRSYLVNAPTDSALAERNILEGSRRWPTAYISFDFLGQLRRTQNRTSEAIAAYTHMIALRPREAAGYKLRADAQALTGNFKEARSDYDTAIRLGNPDAVINYALARSFVSAFEGKFDQCLKELEELERALPGMRSRALLQQQDSVSDAVFQFALRLERFDLAEEAARRLSTFRVQLDSSLGGGFSKADLEIVRIWFEMQVDMARRDYPRARAKLEQVERLAGPELMTALGHAGQIALGEQSFVLAEKQLLKAARTPVVLYALAQTMEGMSRQSDAKAYLLEIVNSKRRVWLPDALVRYDAEQKLVALGNSTDSLSKTIIRK